MILVSVSLNFKLRPLHSFLGVKFLWSGDQIIGVLDATSGHRGHLWMIIISSLVFVTQGPWRPTFGGVVFDCSATDPGQSDSNPKVMGKA